ncbi:hypothetical protein [Saccharopolyspora sp. NPDC050642]|uniref:hypothetical protein n=1 Tax=Saccharopolyspora sp. NPDC050642 TaxID=3157099 RepID=UPI0033D47CE0
MEHLVDLDILADRLEAVIAEWRLQAEVGPLTWRAAHAPWPQSIVADRASVEVPESLGVRLRRGPDDEIEVVVWAGGWADVAYLLDGDVTNLCPEFQDVDGAYAAVVKNVADFLA